MAEPLRIAIVEDDPQNAEIQRRFVQRIANTELCGIAHSVQEAQDLIDVFQPQLVLLDVHLPDGNGLELLRQWRMANQQVDIILITAAKDVETLRSALHAGVFEYILKPLAFDRLEDAIQRYSKHLTQLNQLQLVQQDQVDALMPINDVSSPSKATRPPKGIDALTLDKVRDTMQHTQHLNAEELGLEIGASRTTARRYLEYLVSTQEVVAEVSYGQVGRPERRYRRS
ncbi:response regulator [Reinekea forsetii]|jgi:two-component system CitB family response regulator|uniref:response regulator n=1 Tax=Reinekea forsetii TaxID=1336806 RepID=UPI002353ADDE|nr:response regulator [Reinekea forsetii]MDO7642631.1 response regulator [Reinekea forsetii]